MYCTTIQEPFILVLSLFIYSDTLLLFIPGIACSPLNKPSCVGPVRTPPPPQPQESTLTLCGPRLSRASLAPLSRLSRASLACLAHQLAHTSLWPHPGHYRLKGKQNLGQKGSRTMPWLYV